MNIYIARSQNGTFKGVENLGHIDPKGCAVALSDGQMCGGATREWTPAPVPRGYRR